MTPEHRSRSDLRPEFAFDMDGVICRPPLGFNVTVRRRFGVRPLPETVRERAALDEMRRARRLLVLALETLRFAGRRPMPDAAEGLAAVAAVARPVLVTGRSVYGRALIDRWLRRYGLREYFTELFPNSMRLGNAQFKLWVAQQRAIPYHVDDDPATVDYLARHGLERVFLRDWPRNRGLTFPPNVTVVRQLPEIAAYLPEG